MGKLFTPNCLDADTLRSYVVSLNWVPLPFYSTAERRVPQLIPVLGSQPAGNVSHKPGGRLPLLAANNKLTLTSLLTQQRLVTVSVHNTQAIQLIRRDHHH